MRGQASAACLRVLGPLGEVIVQEPQVFLGSFEYVP